MIVMRPAAHDAHLEVGRRICGSATPARPVDNLVKVYCPPNPPAGGAAGEVRSVLQGLEQPSEDGLSFETYGRLGLLTMLRSAKGRAVLLAIIGPPRRHGS